MFPYVQTSMLAWHNFMDAHRRRETSGSDIKDHPLIATAAAVISVCSSQFTEPQFQVSQVGGLWGSFMHSGLLGNRYFYSGQWRADPLHKETLYIPKLLTLQIPVNREAGAKGGQCLCFQVIPETPWRTALQMTATNIHISNIKCQHCRP